MNSTAKLLAQIDDLNDEVNALLAKDRLDNGEIYSLCRKHEQTITLLATQIGNLERGLHKIIDEAPGHGEDRSYLTAKATLKHQFDERTA